MSADGIERPCDTDTSQENVEGPRESQGGEDNPTDCLFEVIAATPQPIDLYGPVCTMPASFLNPGAPTRTSQSYELPSSAGTCLGRLRRYDVPFDSGTTWKDVRGNKLNGKTGTQTKQVYEFEHMHYRLRGKELENMSPYEYAALINIEHRPDMADRNKKRQNKWFDFDEASHLYPCWVQKLASAMPTLILSSRRPKWPGLLPENALDSEKEDHQKQLNDFGAYYVALFRPRINCFAGTQDDLTQYDWPGFCSMAKGFREEKTVIGYARLDTLSKTMFAMVVTSSTKEKIKAFRGRHRRMWTDTEKADNHLYNKFIRKQKYQFQARLLDRIDHDDIAGKRALLRLLNIQITEQRLQEEVTMSAPNYLIDSLSQTAETCFYKPDCYQYLIHPVTSISGHLSEIHQTIKAAKHDRHYVIKDDDQSNDNGVRIPEAEYVLRKRKVL
jgi:hypothetical protein